VVALTKADKLSRPKQTRQVGLLSRQLEVPREQMLLTSAQTGLGIDELRHLIEKACD
jgi:GTP-binding protein